MRKINYHTVFYFFLKLFCDYYICENYFIIELFYNRIIIEEFILSARFQNIFISNMSYTKDTIYEHNSGWHKVPTKMKTYSILLKKTPRLEFHHDTVLCGRDHFIKFLSVTFINRPLENRVLPAGQNEQLGLMRITNDNNSQDNFGVQNWGTFNTETSGIISVFNTKATPETLFLHTNNSLDFVLEIEDSGNRQIHVVFETFCNMNISYD